MYPTPSGPAVGAFVERQIAGLRRIGLDIEVMVIDRRNGGMGSYFRMSKDLLGRIECFQPDVVHVMYGGVMAERVTHIVKDRPTMVSFCGSDLLGDLLSGSARRIVSEYGIFCSHVAARRTAGIVVKSQNLEQALPATINRSKVRIIPNGVDFERFRPLEQVACRKQLGWELDRFHVLFPTNGGDHCKRLDLAQSAIKAANHSGLNAELHQLQGLPHDQVPTWINASDVVLLTSSQEGSPNVVKEALACNVPVVSVDVGDVQERLSDISGCYIASPDPDDLRAKLGLVQSKRNRITGREGIRHLSLERISLTLEKFYRQTVETFCRREVTSSQKLDSKAFLDYGSSLMVRRRKFKEITKERLRLRSTGFLQ